MTDSEVNESLVTAETSQGMEFRASILRLTRHSVVFEIYNPAWMLRLSEVLTNFKILLYGKGVYSGRAVVNHLVNTGTMAVCETSLEEGWLDVDFFAPFDSGIKLRDQFNDFIKEWQKNYQVLPQYKQAVVDTQTFLADLRRWIEQVELGVRSCPSVNGGKLEREVAEDLAQSTTPVLTALFERFEEAAALVEADMQPSHRTFARQQLHPLLLCAPFLYRTFHKPLGYAGDYEMVNMIVRPPFEGASLFAKLVNVWFLNQPPAEAHRNRILYLTDRIVESTAAAIRTGRVARILSLGCGPAWEVQRFLEERHFSNQARFALLDFNTETLDYARSTLEGIKRKYSRTTELQFFKRSVAQIAKDGGRTFERSKDSHYDLIYCAGLFDYLPDSLCRRLCEVFYDWLAPGGLLITTNVDIYNPRRLTMEYVMDWHLIYRSGAELAAFKPTLARPDYCAVKSDTTGVNIYFEATKPEQ